MMSRRSLPVRFRRDEDYGGHPHYIYFEKPLRNGRHPVIDFEEQTGTALAALRNEGFPDAAVTTASSVDHGGFGIAAVCSAGDNLCARNRIDGLLRPVAEIQDVTRGGDLGSAERNREGLRRVEALEAAADALAAVSIRFRAASRSAVKAWPDRFVNDYSEAGDADYGLKMRKVVNEHYSLLLDPALHRTACFNYEIDMLLVWIGRLDPLAERVAAAAGRRNRKRFGKAAEAFEEHRNASIVSRAVAGECGCYEPPEVRR